MDLWNLCGSGSRMLPWPARLPRPSRGGVGRSRSPESDPGVGQDDLQRCDPGLVQVREHRRSWSPTMNTTLDGDAVDFAPRRNVAPPTIVACQSRSPKSATIVASPTIVTPAIAPSRCVAATPKPITEASVKTCPGRAGPRSPPGAGGCVRRCSTSRHRRGPLPPRCHRVAR